MLLSAEFVATIQTGNNHVQLIENESFLVSLSQDIEIPEDPQSITFDLLDLNLGATEGNIPDVFEVSLLSSDSQSLVPTIDAAATSFLNANPDGQRETAAGVEILGSTITLDISQVASGTVATLIFDLVGNESQTNSSAAIGNVVISPEVNFVETFTVNDLPGTYVATAGVGYCDANHDGHLDIVVEESASGELLILAGDGQGAFTPPPSAFSISTTPEGESVNRSVDIGEVVADEIQASGETDSFTFTASQGQRLFFDAQDTTGLQTWSLSNASGETLFMEGFADQDGIEISESGTYTLAVSGFLLAEGPYQFQIHEIPTTTTTGIAIGQPVEGTLAVPGEQLEFQFDVVESGSFFFDAQIGESVFVWTLLDPTGGIVFDESFVDPPVRMIDQAGTYTLRVDGELDTIGDFGFQIHEVTPSDPQSINFDQVIAGELTIPGEQDLFLLEGAADDVIYFDAQGGDSSEIEVELKSSDGNVVVTGSLQDHGPIALPITGAYTLDISGVADATGDYEFTVWQVPNTSARSIDLDEPVVGSIRVPGEVQSFEFMAQFGDSIVFDEIHNTGGQLRYTLTSPTDQTLFGNVSGDQPAIELNESGTFTLLIDGLNETTSPFSFQIGGGTNAPPIPSAPNLIVTRVDAPSVVMGGTPAIQVEWEMQNDGDVAVPAGTELRHDFYLSADRDLDQLDVDPRVGTTLRTLGNDLAPGDTVVLTESFDLPIDADREFKVIVNVDADNVVFEGVAEDDNFADASVAAYASARNLVGDPVLQLDLANGTEFPEGTSVTFAGNVSTERGAVNTVFMLDLSGSTALISGLDTNFDGVVDDRDDMNSDGRVGDLLDKQIGLVFETIDRMVST